MGDNDRATTLGNDPAANAPDAAVSDKGKGKAVEPTTQEMSMDEDEESEESENEEMVRHPRDRPDAILTLMTGRW